MSQIPTFPFRLSLSRSRGIEVKALKHYSALAALAVALVMGPWMAQGLTLGEALNATNLTWTTSGEVGGWAPQTATSHDGVAAARGRASLTQSATLQTTVTGPGTLTFWWSNGSFYNELSFSIGGTLMSFIILYPSWQPQTFYLGSGSQTLRWVDKVVYPPGNPFDYAFLDEVTWVPGTTAPLIVSQPTGQSQVPGMDATFTVSAGGTPPLSYQWAFNGTNIPGATTSTCTVTNVQAASVGNYSVLVTNDYGSIMSSNAPLELGQITAWGSSGYGATLVPTGATNVQAIAAGYYNGLFLDADGALVGWGLQAIAPTGLSNLVSMSVYQDALALEAGGTVVAWRGTNYSAGNVPAGLSNVVAVAAGRMSHSMALETDGTVAAWGGFLGETNVPSGLSSVVAIAGGSGFDLVLLADGTVSAWGNRSPGVPNGLSNVVAIAAGVAHGVALLANGTVTAWGDNGYGQATAPAGLSNVCAIAAGDFYSMALLTNGTVVTWGHQSSGALSVPGRLTNVVAIAAGAFHCVALVGSGPPILRAPISQPTLTGSGFSVTVLSERGRVYALEYRASLGDGPWSSLPLVAGTGSNLTLTDPTRAAGPRFYRVRRW